MRSSRPLTKKKGRTDCEPLRRNFACFAVLRILASRLSDYGETEGILPDGQGGFRPARSTINILCVVGRLQELGRQRKIPLYLCFIDLQKAYTTLLTVKAAVGGTHPLWRTNQDAYDCARNFHEGMRTRGRTDDGEHSKWFVAAQGLRQGQRVMTVTVQCVIRCYVARCTGTLQQRRTIARLLHTPPEN